MTSDHNFKEQYAGQELVIERILQAPPGRVWQAWSDPQQFMRWWGPRALTVPLSQIDFRVGGKYLYCMRGPDMPDTYGTGVYREIIEPKRIVFTDAFADPQGNPVPASYYGVGDDFPDEMLVIVNLEDLGGGQTRLKFQHLGVPTGEMAEMTRASWNESFDKLEELLRSGE